MSEVKFKTAYKIRENGDMDVMMVQTEPVTKEIKVKDIGGIKMLRGIPKDPPLTDTMVFRIPAKMITPFLGCMIQIANDYAMRMEKLQKMKEEGRI